MQCLLASLLLKCVTSIKEVEIIFKIGFECLWAWEVFGVRVHGQAGGVDRLVHLRAGGVQQSVPCQCHGHRGGG